MSVRSVETGGSPVAAVALVLLFEGKQQQMLIGLTSENDGKVEFDLFILGRESSDVLVEMWQDALSRAAFPRAYEVLNGPGGPLIRKNSSLSPTGQRPTMNLRSHSDDVYDDPWDCEWETDNLL